MDPAKQIKHIVQQIYLSLQPSCEGSGKRTDGEEEIGREERKGEDKSWLKRHKRLILRGAQGTLTKH